MGHARTDYVGDYQGVAWRGAAAGGEGAVARGQPGRRRLAVAFARGDDFLHERADADLALAAEVLGVGLAGQLHTPTTTTLLRIPLVVEASSIPQARPEYGCVAI